MASDQHKPRVLITGANGQVGWELQRRPESHDWNVHAVTREELDIADANAVNKIVEEVKPEIIINAAAYTAVDKAEAEEELAYQVNAEGAGNLALSASKVGAKMIHISTDYVFDGTNYKPYKVDDIPNPVNVYGSSKLAGEQNVLDAISDDALILRTSWVYSAHGNNFVKTMLRLMRERSELRVVADQIGTPTWARNIADVIWGLCRAEDIKGIHHWTDAGVASWYDFAVLIKRHAINQGLLDKDVNIFPISTEEYPTAAARPPISILENTLNVNHEGLQHWSEACQEMISEVAVHKS